jgi:hypothetical protein
MKRWTNLALLVLLGVAFTSGWVAFFYNGAPSRWSLLLHAWGGYAILLLAPWKSVIAAHGVRRRRPGWWLSLVFSLLVMVSIVAGMLQSTGLLISAGNFSAMEVHVGAALAAAPLALWHFVARRVPYRPVDLSRRSLLRGGVLALLAGAVYASSEGSVRLLQLAGSRRRLTGSYEVGSLRPELLPVTQWLFDPVPLLQSSTWRLRVAAQQTRVWSYDELLGFNDSIRATLDCTGGFYSTQDWSGVRISRLLPPGSTGSSLRVRSATGYERRFPLEDAGRLLLATGVGGAALAPGHGFPVRLIAPDRRGYWWVKWVTSIDVEAAPDWWQLPFPIQ